MALATESEQPLRGSGALRSTVGALGEFLDITADRAPNTSQISRHWLRQLALGLLSPASLLVAATVVTAISFVMLDVPIAKACAPYTKNFDALTQNSHGEFLVGLEAALITGLVLLRVFRGRLPKIGKAVIVALGASICAYAINTVVLKVLFGVPAPWQLLEGAPHAVSLFGGSKISGFPSGHMALAGAFAGVFMRRYRQTILPLGLMLLGGGAILTFGGWHFLSDVLAGTFVGVTIGRFAGSIWLSRKRLVPIARRYAHLPWTRQSLSGL